MKTEPIVIERTFNAPIERVWKALTDKDQIKQWSFDMKGFRPEAGCEFRFEGGKDDLVYHHISKVTEIVPGKKISYSWRYEGFEGNSLVSFELFAEDDKTRLKLTHTGLETFPQNNSDFARESFSQGWTHIIGISLKKFVEEPQAENI